MSSTQTISQAFKYRKPQYLMGNTAMYYAHDVQRGTVSVLANRMSKIEECHLKDVPEKQVLFLLFNSCGGKKGNF